MSDQIPKEAFFDVLCTRYHPPVLDFVWLWSNSGKIVSLVLDGQLPPMKPEPEPAQALLIPPFYSEPSWCEYLSGAVGSSPA